MGNLLYTVAVVLIIIWAVGFVGYSYTGGGIIHVLLLIAAIAILLRVIQGRRII
jgi:tryptophan-rich sensory protein